MKVETDNDRSWMSAVTFAEAGEWETARTMIPLPSKNRWAEFLERTFMAVAFAEAGMPEEAVRLVGMKQQAPKRIKTFLESIGLRDARITYGVLQEEAVW